MLNSQFFSLFTYFLLLVFGSSIGSFLNVVIYRLPQNQPLGGRSRADCCRQTLTWKDLIPILSYLISFGKCRYCQKTISFSYPLVETLTALASIASFSLFPFPESLYYFVNFCFLIVFFFTDLKYGVVPFSLFLLNLVFVFAFNLMQLLSQKLGLYELTLTVSFAVTAFLFFRLLIFLTHGRGMGLGDALLAFLFSLISAFPASVVMIFLSFVFGGNFALLLLLSGKKKLGQSLPFAPFMTVATFVSIFWAPILLSWYLRTFLP